PATGILSASFKAGTDLLEPPFMIYINDGGKWHRKQGPLLNLHLDTLQVKYLSVKLRFPDGSFSNELKLELSPVKDGGWIWYSLLLLPLAVFPFLRLAKTDKWIKREDNLASHPQNIAEEYYGLTTPILFVPPVNLPDEGTLNKLYKIQDLVFEDQTDPDLNVSRLADLFHVSERQIYRLTKDVFGITPLQYLTGLKLQKALFLIYNSQIKTVADLAFECGFQKPSYFSGLFKERFGRSPKQVLKSKSNPTP
ncbi:MAG: helix-turn-helix transcriptional regulator, partial [Owenweeksia sp.]